MAKEQKKGLPLVAIVIAIIVVVVLGLLAWRIFANSNNSGNKESTNKYVTKARTSADIKINDNDSDEVKTEKIQGKIELLNKEIDEKQQELNNEYEKINKLYEEYVSVVNEYQSGTVEDTVPEEQSGEENPEE